MQAKSTRYETKRLSSFLAIQIVCELNKLDKSQLILNKIKSTNSLPHLVGHHGLVFQHMVSFSLDLNLHEDHPIKTQVIRENLVADNQKIVEQIDQLQSTNKMKIIDKA